MEMTAVIHGIKKAKANGWSKYTIYTDSQYVMNGATKWIKGWQKKGWKTASGSDVKNKPPCNICLVATFEFAAASFCTPTKAFASGVLASLASFNPVTSLIICK